MGQHADDILEGVTCQGCGEFFDDIINGGDAPGFPRWCERCGPSPVPSRRKGPSKPPTPPQPMTPERIKQKTDKAKRKRLRYLANRAQRERATGAA